MMEKRLIDANALPNYKCQVTATIGDQKGPAEMRFVFWKDIENAPTISAVPVVRCRECWRHQTVNCPMFLRGGDYACPDGFCHMGAKMDAKEMDVHTKDGGAADGV